MRTAYSTANAQFSEAAHEAAKQQVYPNLFRSRNLRFESTLVGTNDRNDILDAQMGVDRIVHVTVPNLQAPLAFTVQERFRKLAFQRYKDVTVTEFNHGTGQPSELYKITSGLFVYGYYDEASDSILEAIAVNTTGLLYRVARGEIHYSTRHNRRSDQSFFAFTFDALKKAGVVDFHFVNGYAVACAIDDFHARKEGLA